MFRKCLALLALCLLSIGVVTAQENGEWKVSFNSRCELGVDSNGYATLSVDGMAAMHGKAGAPALPTMSRLVILPQGSKLELADSVESSGEVSYHLPKGVLLAPIPVTTPKDEEPQSVMPDSLIYSADAFYRACPAFMVEHLGTMGQREVYRLTVAPASYNPKHGEILVSTTITATLKTTPHSSLSTLHSSLYHIVAPSQFREGLKDFVAWKRQEGFLVNELYIDTDDRDSIKAMIANQCSGEGDYILLVGDAEPIPPFPGTTRPEGFTTHTTDLYYAEFTGDYLPDALLGRWPVNDTAELRRVVEKTLRYEQGRGLDTALLRRALLVAGREGQQPAPVTTNGQVNYVKGLMPWMDTMCYYNPASNTQRAEILQDIDAGTALVNYTAHCSANGWTRPAVDYTAIDTLGESQPAFYINNCCKSNAFDGDGFGEQLLRKSVGGGVGVIGATNSTLWNEDYYWSVGPKYPFSLEPERDSLRRGAFDEWLDGDALSLTASGIMTAGNMAVTAFGSPYDKFYWEIYCLLGDPSLRPYIGVPHQLCVAVDTLRAGATLLNITATPGARVTAVQGTMLLGVADAGADSTVQMWLGASVDTLPLIITATAPQAIPTVDTILPLLPQGVAFGFRNLTVTDTVVDFSLVYFGDDTLYNPYVCLLPDSADALFIATVHLIDTLLPHAEMPMHTTLDIVRWAPQWSGTLEASDADGNVLCSLRMGHALDPAPTLSFLLLNADSTVATSVMPNTEYILAVSVDGQYDTLSVTAEPLVSLSSELPRQARQPQHGVASTGSAATARSSEVFGFSNNNSELHCPFTTPDSITHLNLHAFVGRGSYGRDYDYWLTAGSRGDDLEHGFDCLPWQQDTPRPWIVDSNERHSGTFSLRPAPIGHRETSDLLLDVLLMAEDSIVFWLKTYSEDGYDKLVFSIDGVQRGSWSGFIPWHRRAYLIPAGKHTLRWRYVKDDSNTAGSDCGWIDDLRLPLALWDSVYGCVDSIETPEPQGILEPVLDVPVLYPNPADRQLHISASGELELTDMLGRRVYSAHTDGNTPIDIGALPPGVYFVTLRCEERLFRYKLRII